MARNNVTLKSSWIIGVIYAVIIAVAAITVILIGINNAMPYELVVYDADQAVTVLFTDDFFYRSRMLMLFSTVFPVAAYLMMYWKYVKLAGEHPEEKEKVKAGKYGNPWIVPMILLLILMVVWGFISGGMISLGLGLDIKLFVDRVMLRQFYLVYLIAMAVDIALLLLGKQFFKPSVIQRA
ncbi:MAG: hypothetical protein MR762_09035 [Clostridiales bacterium]|nr:hypothetical protein [Clostridiales bacterium]